VPLSGPDSVIVWNRVAQRTAIQVAKQFQAQSAISIAFAQAAVYDAVIAIDGGYTPYQVRLQPRPGASVDAAVAAAAHDVLVHYFPAQQPALDADYMQALSTIPDGTPKAEGTAVGQAAAAGLIALRQGDVLDGSGGLSLPPAAPGVWQPPIGQDPQTPWVATLRPFLLERPDQFRPGPPPPLTSAEWAAEFDEVKRLGRSDSLARTAEQTDIARFWSTNGVVQYNTAFAQIATERHFTAREAARLFAMGNLVGADALIACFDAKYHYLFWRPQSAVPLADTDGNPATPPDAAWTPLLATPNHPEYPAAHGCWTAAEAEVLTRVLGTTQIAITMTSTTPNLTRSARTYRTANALVHEIIDARVWGGVHYRESVVKGVDVGRNVARWALKRYFRPQPRGCAGSRTSARASSPVQDGHGVRDGDRETDVRFSVIC
jgi:hypothetical protein